jgi:hypothetical protein
MSDETKRIDAQPTTMIGEEKAKPKALYAIIGILGIIVVALSLVLVFGVFKDKSKSTPKVKQMHKLVSKIRNLETDVNQKQGEIMELIKDYREKTGETLPTMDGLSLTDQEKELLEEKIQNEQDVSIKSLLSDIIDKKDEISELQGKIKILEALLPSPHVVAQGENHYQIAMEYLLNEKGIEKNRALKLIERTAMFEPLIPGFKVWNFYSGEEYGTFITQGSAPISPNTIRRKAKKKLVDARDNAIAEKDKLSEEIGILEQKREQIIGQVDDLNREKQNLIVKVTDLGEKNSEMQTTINSVYYLLDKKRSLLDKKIIKGGFLRSPRLKNVSPELFSNSLDMRETNTIEVQAKQFQLKKIKKIVIYPKFYKKDSDYEITIDEAKQYAVIKLVSAAKFKNDRIVISVE